MPDRSMVVCLKTGRPTNNPPPRPAFCLTSNRTEIVPARITRMAAAVDLRGQGPGRAARSPTPCHSSSCQSWRSAAPPRSMPTSQRRASRSSSDGLPAMLDDRVEARRPADRQALSPSSIRIRLVDAALGLVADEPDPADPAGVGDVGFPSPPRDPGAQDFDGPDLLDPFGEQVGTRPDDPPEHRLANRRSCTTPLLTRSGHHARQPRTVAGFRHPRGPGQVSAGDTRAGSDTVDTTSLQKPRHFLAHFVPFQDPPVMKLWRGPKP